MAERTEYRVAYFHAFQPAWSLEQAEEIAEEIRSAGVPAKIETSTVTETRTPWVDLPDDSQR